MERVCCNRICPSSDQASSTSARPPSCEREVSIVMCEAEEAELAASTAQTGEHDTTHFDGYRLRILQLWRKGDNEHAACR